MNQFAVRHLSAALLWMSRGGKKMIPNRADIFCHAMNLRRGGIRVAKLALGQVHPPDSF